VMFLLLYRCVVFCCVIVLFVVLFDTGRAISLIRIPSNAFYQKPKWFFYGATDPRGPGFPRYQVSTITLIHKHTHTHTQETDRQTSMPTVGFKTAIPGKTGGADRRLRTRGYWERLQAICWSKYKGVSKQAKENKIAKKKMDLKTNFNVMFDNTIWELIAKWTNDYFRKL
jgi:hypothetical protein